jgi:hypothetical protein
MKMSEDRNFSMIEYFNRKAEAIKPKYRFSGQSKTDFVKWQSALLADLKLLWGQMPQTIPLNPKIVSEVEEDGLIKQRVLLDLEKDMSVTALLYIPLSARKKACPAILCNHGHAFSNFGKDLVMGVRDDNFPERPSEIQQFNYDYGLQMAKRGYVTMAIDYRGFGDRSDGGNPYPGRDRCNVHFIRGSLMGYNLLALNIFDAMRCLDYLCSLEFVNAERIGTMGLSFGGTMTTWIALLDQRIKAADIICYSCRFKKYAVADGNFCGSQYLPGLFALCDVPDLHGLIAPRPLLAEIGIHDKCFFESDALCCSVEVKKIYAAAGVPENYEVDHFDDGHKFAGNKAFGFFDKHLKG